MKKFFFLAILIGIVCGCNESKHRKSNLLNISILPTQSFKIDTNQDTTLTTQNGAIIRIPKGALSTSGGPEVTIEIKEAYTIEQMLQAGLYTQSNGRPLSSGGMIYLNVSGTEPVIITNTISVSIPTPFIDDAMQLFKGEMNEDSTINWVEPEPMPQSAFSLGIDSGKNLYNSLTCNACHMIGKDMTGPDLAHIVKRSPEYELRDTINEHNLLYDFTINNQQVLASGNPYYTCLYNRWNKTPMNMYTKLTYAQLKLLYDYIENESERRNLPIPKTISLACLDSCVLYNQVVSRLTSEKDRLSQQKVRMVKEEIENNITRANPGASYNEENGILPLKVNPIRKKSLYYQFTLKGFGWYNIDFFLGDQYGSVMSELRVKIDPKYSDNTELYLVLPHFRNLSPGGLLEGEKDVYGFYLIDGTIPLPQDAQAYVIGIGEEKDQILYAIHSFKTQKKVEIDLKFNTITLASFNNKMRQLNFDSLSIQSAMKEAGIAIKKIEKELKNAESLKPQNCDCDCLAKDKDYMEKTR